MSSFRDLLAATKAVVAAQVGVEELTGREAKDLHRLLKKLRAGADDFA